MISSIQFISDLHQAGDIQGESLCQPLNAYNYFFTDASTSSSALQRISAKAAHIATGILAYPLYGILSSVGLLVKLTGIVGVQEHSEDEKDMVLLTKATIETSIRCHCNSRINMSMHNTSLIRSHLMEREVYTVQKDLEGLATIDSMIEKIDEYTGKFQKVYVTATQTEETTSEVTFKLSTIGSWNDSFLDEATN